MILLDLVNKHKDNSSITEAGLREETEGVGMVKEFITKSPVNASS